MSVGAVNKSTGDRIPTAGMPAIDAALSGSSTNPVQNMVVKAALDGKVDAVSGKGLSTNDYTNADKAIVDGVTTALAGKVDISSVGSASGVAELDTNGKVPSSQLPSYVDDVLEYASQSAFPAEGETGKIYIAKDTNKTYRWSGTAYVEISESLALGETSSTAYAGNKGKANADAISAIKDGTSIDSFADVETALAKKVNVFTGTQAEWAALSTAEKKTYQRADFTDDYDNTAIGDLTALHTSAKSSIVNAINEVADGKQNATDNNLQTTSKTIVGGINEVKSGLNKIKKISITAPSDLSSTAIGADVAIPIDAGYNGWLVIGVYLYAYGQNRGILECFSISTIVNNTITLLSLNKELASGYNSASGYAIVVDPG